MVLSFLLWMNISEYWRYAGVFDLPPIRLPSWRDSENLLFLGDVETMIILATEIRVVSTSAFGEVRSV